MEELEFKMNRDTRLLREEKREQSQRLGKRGWVTALNKNKSRSQGLVERERDTQSHKLRQQGQAGVRNEKSSSQSSVNRRGGAAGWTPCGTQGSHWSARKGTEQEVRKDNGGPGSRKVN